MADFAMRNLRHFPMEKSSYDLKLELLEELGPKEACELMKANNRFRSIYLQDPWRIFGRHVHSIRFFRNENKIEICKLRESAPLICDHPFDLPFLKKIKRCVMFSYDKWGRTQQSIDTARKILSNLISIGEWERWIEEPVGFKEYFSYFKGQVTDCIRLGLAWYTGVEDVLTFSFMSKVFENQLGNCKRVEVFGCTDPFLIYYKLLLKTKIKRIECRLTNYQQLNENGLEMAMRWIVCTGIPSQDRKAEISVSLEIRRPHPAYDSLVNFLPAFPGMQQLPNEKDMRSYRRKIDDERDCVYCVYQLEGIITPVGFSAKYVPSQAR